MDFWIDLSWRLLIGVAVAVTVTFAWAFTARLLRPLNKPLSLSTMSGRIRPWPPIWWLMTAFLALVTLGGFFSSFVMDGIGAQAMMWIISAFLSVLVWASFLCGLPSAALSWNETGVEGPSSTLSTNRASIEWSQISSIGNSTSGNYFISDHRGHKVYWSWCYVGHAYFWNALLTKRPDLQHQAEQTAANG